MKNQKDISVYINTEPGQNKHMGTLRAVQVRGEEIFSFEYAPAWLKDPLSRALDPDLELYTGPQYAPAEKQAFGIFTDSAPDRLGRTLMDRREALNAKAKNRPRRTLMETDYLLGVSDHQRAGALRLKLTDSGPFLAEDNGMDIPPFSSLRELEEAVRKTEQNENMSGRDEMKWFRILLAPGSSLGGARPKAGVKDPQSNLWIAKFPSKNDDRDSGAWEKTVMDMAKDCGLRIPETDLIDTGRNQHTFLTKRFDRSGPEKRIHYASAMTLLGYMDRHKHSDGASYLEIAKFIIRNGAQPDEDLLELWKRILFSICISNTDDHLRNHGFLLTPDGWILSPVFDINPNEKGTGLTLNINETDNSLDPLVLLETAGEFRLREKEAEKEADRIFKIVRKWKSYAVKNRITGSEQERMEPAFNAVR